MVQAGPEDIHWTGHHDTTWEDVTDGGDRSHEVDAGDCPRSGNYGCDMYATDEGAVLNPDHNESHLNENITVFTQIVEEALYFSDDVTQLMKF